MAIKFVDIEPEGEGEPKLAKRESAPAEAESLAPEMLKESIEPELSHTSLTQRKRARKVLLP